MSTQRVRLSLVIGLLTWMVLPLVSAAGEKSAGGPLSLTDPDVAMNRPRPAPEHFEVPLESPDAAALADDCLNVGVAPPKEPFSLPNRYRGNALRIVDTAELTEIKMELRFGDSGDPAIVDLYYTVHQRASDVQDPSTAWDWIFCSDPIPSVGDGVTRFYSSGVIDPPVLLEAGYDYAIAVAWGDWSVTFLKDFKRYPKSFVDGEILGSVFQTGIEPPLCEPLTFSNVITSGAYSMKYCFAPKPGACCLGGGVCEELTQSECIAANGDFSDQRVPCEQNSCPFPKWGCCLSDENCVSLNQFDCAANGGEWHEGDPCSEDPAENPCPPQGACCLDDGTCMDVNQAKCVVLDGVYRGDDTLCDEIDPPCDFGACCVGSSCLLLTEAGCADTPGVWRGHGSDCDSGQCDNPGACCDGMACSDGLEGMTETACEAPGVYQGDWTTCDTLSAGCGLGACCSETYGCFDDTTQTDCISFLIGIWQGEGTSCDTLDPQCRDLGGCCYGAGTCGDGWSSAFCETRPGNVFLGDQGTCGSCSGSGDACTANEDCWACSVSGVPCLSDQDCGATGGTCQTAQTCVAACPAVGQACCLPNGTCITATTQACTSLYGTAQGAASMCGGLAPGTCDLPALGACCLADGQCSEVTEARCTAEGGDFRAGDACSLDLCAIGACCMDDGTCVGASVKLQDCVAADGDFYAGRACDICPAAGACCLPDQSCDVLTRQACQASSGVYQGDLMACEPDGFCHACCHTDGSCAETVSAVCAQDNGDFRAADDCADETCPPGGACCQLDLTCKTRTATLCNAAGGSYRGDNTVCGDSECGACCGNDGACTPNVIASECPPDFGTYSLGVKCAEAQCALAGACCLPDEDDCKVLTEQACAAELPPNVYMGDLTNCDGDSCVTGACCHEGECSDVLEPECATLGGEFYDGQTCDDSPCPGACCLGSGSCLVSLLLECEGEFSAGEDCDSITCGGACCLSSGSCSISSASECTTRDGMFTAGGECGTCEARGACCAAGDCTENQTRQECEATAGGAYQGDESECGGGICMLGGCCHLDGTCDADKVRSECSGVDDVFNTAGCGNFPCSARGACCADDGTCTLEIQGACVVLGRSYGGDGTNCGASCEPGACCLGPFGDGCVMLDVAACENVAGGVFHDGGQCGCELSGTACSSDDGCDQACSESGLVCTLDDECDVGICFGQDDVCSLSAHDHPLVCAGGAECVLDETCTDEECTVSGISCASDADCDDGKCAGTNAACSVELNQNPLLCPAGFECLLNEFCREETCVAGICARGGCCRVDGTCDEDVVELECSGSGDIFTQGHRCDVGCDERGVCCVADQCSLETQTACVDDLGGTFSVDLKVCSPGLCETGACCMPDGSCVNGLLGAQCESSGGSPQGTNTSCDDGQCHACCAGDGICSDTVSSVCAGQYLASAECADQPCLGVCCLPDGTCDNLAVGGCDAGGGRFEAEGDCATATCEQFGACCSDGQCSVEYASECAAVQGVYQGDGTNCDDDSPCTLGACCRADRTCGDRLVASQCAGDNEVFQEGRSCGLASCEDLGACCVTGEGCQLLSEPECSVAGGAFGGAGSECPVETCADMDCDDGDLCTIDTCDDSVCGAPPACAHTPVSCPVGQTCCSDGACKENCVDCEALVAGFPPNCAIDARQPSWPDGTNPDGWQQIVLTFDPPGCDASTLPEAAFVVEVLPDGTPPGLTGVNAVDDTVTLDFAPFIELKKWTCFSHQATTGRRCIGYLPGNVNGDSTSSPAIDLSALIDCLNNPGTCEDWQQNINRDSAVNVADLTRLIDLYNGAAEYVNWTGAGIDPCPSLP